MLFTVLTTWTLAATPVCARVSPEAESRLGSGWREQLGARLGRPVEVSEACVGDLFEARLVDGQMEMAFTKATTSRRMSLGAGGGDPETFSLVAAVLVADTDVADSRVDLRPTMHSAPVPEKQATEWLWAYAGGGISLASGMLMPTIHLGLAVRFTDTAVGLETLQVGGFISGGAQSLYRENAVAFGSQRWDLCAMGWIGRGVSQHVRLDAGLGLGMGRLVAPWEPIPSHLVGSDTPAQRYSAVLRPVARLRITPIRPLAVDLRFDVGIPLALKSETPPGIYAGLQLGVGWKGLFDDQ